MQVVSPFHPSGGIPSSDVTTFQVAMFLHKLYFIFRFFGYNSESFHYNPVFQ